MNIIVCMKQVLDPEAPASIFRIDPDARRAIPAPGVPPVINPYDENALEAALRIKDLHQCEVTAISMGTKLAKAVLRKALAVGADALLLLEDNALENLDSYSTTLMLTAAINKMGKFDLILTGRMAADTNAGQVGSGIAEVMGIPSITAAKKVEVIDSRLRVQRVISDGYEVIESPLPALVTVSHELGELRSVPLQQLMAVQKKPVTVWACQDLGIVAPPMSRTRMLKLHIPHKEARCEVIGGETEEGKGANLALKLREARIV